MNYNTISAQRIAGALGAEIAGVDLSGPLSDEVIGEIRQALLDHQVIFFHDQHLTPEQHLAFGRRFGELQIHDFVEPAEEDQHILEVRKEPYETRNFGGGWHTDVSYLERPSLGSVLYAREVPAVGGDTMFASQYLAYDALSDGMKAMLGGMTAIHSAGRIYGVNPDRSLAALPSSMTIRYTEEAHGETKHPVVRTHVETGRKCLYVNGNFTVRFKDMTEEESAPLLSWLYRHAVRPEFTCRFRWRRIRSRSGTTAVSSTTPSTTIRASAGSCTGSRSRASDLSERRHSASDGRSVSRANRRLRLLYSPSR